MSYYSNESKQWLTNNSPEILNGNEKRIITMRYTTSKWRLSFAMIMCVQITGKLVLCKFSANNEDKMSIFFGVSKVARGHNFVSRYPMNGCCAVQDMMRRHVPRITSSVLRRQNVVPGSCCMKFNWFEFVTKMSVSPCVHQLCNRHPSACWGELLHGR